MSEYTDQEIEMLVGFMHEYQYPGASKDDMEIWQACMWCRDVQKALVPTRDESDSAPTIRAAARLMREAREQGRLDAESQARSDIAAMQSERDAELDRAVKQAREQGAAEMRKQVIAALRALPDGTWGDERGEMSPWPNAIDAVKALTVPQ